MGGLLAADSSAWVEINDEDQALAESVVLRLDGFPDGWSTQQPLWYGVWDRGCLAEQLDLADVTITGESTGDAL
ncbi:MAG: hypothetical protein OXG37_11140 [Actinomycetia bacterium]|nr:hypothetical protein [Actinomycetes bacterium]